jgi:RNase H-like domain found in reverse transcriptase
MNHANLLSYSNSQTGIYFRCSLNPGCLLMIETDASDYALAVILSQVKRNGEIHPVTYLSQTFSDTKLNYDTHDKELMVIYKAFKAWRHYLEGTKVLIDVGIYIVSM